MVYANKSFDLEYIGVKLLSQVESFLFGASEAADHLKHALERVRSELAAPSKEITVCLAAIRFKIGQDTLFILEMPESGDIPRDVGPYNPEWKIHLSASLSM